MVLRRIDEASFINKDDLNEDQYFLSILEKGYENALLDRQSADNIQIDIAYLLSELIKRYTSGDSSSVKEETAHTILGSIYYIIDAYAASLSSPGDIFTAIREKGIREIYNDGVSIVKDCYNQAKQLYDEIILSKLKVPLAPYNDTLDIAMPDFFKAYDIEFNAQDTPCSIDYPLAFDEMTDKGIYYILHYLEKLKLETQFCSCFTQKSLLKFLYAYEAKYHMDIIDAPINLFEILFDQLVFSALSGNRKMELTVSAPQLNLIVQELSGKTHKQIRVLIDNATQNIIDGQQLKGQPLIDYIDKYKTQFTKRLIMASDNQNISHMVIVNGENRNAEKIVFNDNERMKDTDFVRLVNFVKKCEDTDDKVKLISENVHSIRDYTDILDAGYLYADEYTSLYIALGDIELAVLGKSVFNEELRGGWFSILPENSSMYKKNAQKEWQKYYLDFVLGADEYKRKEIENLINNLTFNNTDFF